MRQEVFGRCVRGASHIRSGAPCQDSYKFKELEDGTVILAVADGHGSSNSPYSRIGSQIAVNIFCSVMERLYTSYHEDRDKLISFLNREGDTKISRTIDTEWKQSVLAGHYKSWRAAHTHKLENEEIYRLYGTTLIGLLISQDFVFAFQLGDGDICCANKIGIDKIIHPERILGVETHSLSRKDAWEKAITGVRRIDIKNSLPIMFALTTDGYSNSYKDEDDFENAILDYLSMIQEYGCKAIQNNLNQWLSETSKMGSGDDISILIAYYSSD